MNLIRVYSPGILEELLNNSIQFRKALYEKSDIDENIIVDILSTTNNEERQIIRNNYKKIFKCPIQNDINSKITKNNLLHDIALNMFDTPYEYDARELKKALSEKNELNEDILVEIFSTRTKQYLEMVDLAYKNFYEISLKEEIQNTLSKEYVNFLFTLMDNERPLEQTISKNQAYEIVEEISKNGIQLYSKDVNMFKKIFVEKSRKDLILISRAYYEIKKKCLYDDILENIPENKSNNIKEEDKVRNKIIRLIKDLIFAVITPAQFLAQKCSIALMKFDINSLLRILISRADIDIKSIRDYYFKEVKRDIKKDIKNEQNLKNNINIGKILINICK